MRKLSALLLLSFLVLQACETKDTPDNEEAIAEIKPTIAAPAAITTILAAPITFNGTLPYSDSTDQHYQLTFAENGKYSDIKHLTSKNAITYVDRGYWIQENDTLITTKSSSGDKHKYAFIDGNMIKLDNRGHRHSGSGADKFMMKKVGGDESRHILVQKQTEGIDYISFGTNPSWIFEMDMDKNLRFKTATDSLITTVPEPVPVNGHKSYVIKNGTISFEAIIKEQFNVDSTNGRIFPYITEIHYKNKIYTAGGVDLSELP